jgi:hypothetical protein
LPGIGVVGAEVVRTWEGFALYLQGKPPRTTATARSARESRDADETGHMPGKPPGKPHHWRVMSPLPH